jgi:hypothetical protein
MIPEVTLCMGGQEQITGPADTLEPRTAPQYMTDL